MHRFVQTEPSLDAYWRAIILFGRNVASYKFALGKSLFELVGAGKSAVTLSELAEPFSRHVCEHLRIEDRQGTFASSRFLDACRKFDRGEIERGALLDTTARYGFENVIDAFHVVNRVETPIRFFRDERAGKRSIAITDELFRLS